MASATFLMQRRLDSGFDLGRAETGHERRRIDGNDSPGRDCSLFKRQAALNGLVYGRLKILNWNCARRVRA